MFLQLTIIAVITFFTFLVKFRSYRRIFEESEVPYLKSWPFIESLKDVVTGKLSLYDNLNALYHNHKVKNEPFFGVFFFTKPVLVIKDFDIISQLFIRDFRSFPNRNLTAGAGDHDPIGSLAVGSADYHRWKETRPRLVPFFSNSKAKQSLENLRKVVNDLQNFIDEKSDENGSSEIELKELFEIMQSDFLANSFLGIDIGSTKNPKNAFIKFAHNFFEVTWTRGFSATTLLLLPGLARFLRIKFFTSSGTKFLQRVVPEIIKQREKINLKKNDLIDTLLEIKKQDPRVTMDYLVAQVGSSFIAGIGSNSSLSSFALYLMAMHPEIQEKVREEIEKFQVDGQISFEDLTVSMKYLHNVVYEVLRLHPSVPSLDRVCINPEGYSMEPHSKLKIPPGMTVSAPVSAMLRDEKYFENPLEFNPDRHSEDRNMTNFLDCLIFGIGPRNCLGKKIGLLALKLSVVAIVQSYFVEKCSKTPKTVSFRKTSFIGAMAEPLIVKLVKIQK